MKGDSMEIKAINIIQNDYIDEENFFLSCEVFIGPKNVAYVYEVYDFNVISIKRLYEEFPDDGVMLNKGWMIAKYYDENEIRCKIDSIIQSCIGENNENTYSNIGTYLRIQES